MLLSVGETRRKTKREPTTPTKSGAQDAWAGAQLVVASPVSALRFGNETENAIGNCGERKQLVLSSERRQSRNRGETLESSSARRWNSFRIKDVRVSFHGSSNELILVALLITRQPRENVEPAEEEDDGTREAKRNQAAGTNNSRAQKQDLPRKRSKAS